MYFYLLQMTNKLQRKSSSLHIVTLTKGTSYVFENKTNHLRFTITTTKDT